MNPAPVNNPVLGPTLQGLEGKEFFAQLLPRMVGLGFVIGILIFFFVMLIGAIQWISSGGDKAALESARGKITSALVGLFLLLALLALIKLIGDFFGINILVIDIGPLTIE